jgi:arylsulfatase
MDGLMKHIFLATAGTAMSLLLAAEPAIAQDGKQIIHDAEHNILAAQHGERWAEEDKAIDARLAEIRGRNGGRPPNIV